MRFHHIYRVIVIKFKRLYRLRLFFLIIPKRLNVIDVQIATSNNNPIGHPTICRFLAVLLHLSNLVSTVQVTLRKMNLNLTDRQPRTATSMITLSLNDFILCHDFVLSILIDYLFFINL